MFLLIRPVFMRDRRIYANIIPRRLINRDGSLLKRSKSEKLNGPDWGNVVDVQIACFVFFFIFSGWWRFFAIAPTFGQSNYKCGQIRLFQFVCCFFFMCTILFCAFTSHESMDSSILLYRFIHFIFQVFCINLFSISQ